MTSQMTILSQAYTLAEHLEKFSYYLWSALPFGLAAFLFLGIGLWWAKRLWFGLYSDTHKSANTSESILSEYSATVDEHANLLESLTTDFHESQNQLAIRDNSIFALNEQVTKIEMDRNGLVQNLSHRDAELAELQKRLSDQELQITELKQTILTNSKTADRNQKKLTHDLLNKDGELEAKGFRIIELEGYLNDRNVAFEGLEILNLELGETKELQTLQLADKDVEIETNANRIGELERTIDQREAEVIDLKEQNQAHTIHIEDLLGTIDQQGAKITDLESLNLSATEQIGILKGDINSRDGAIQGLELQYQELGEAKEVEAQDLTNTIVSKDGEIEAWHNRANELQEVISDREAKIDSLGNESLEYQDQIEQLHALISEKDEEIEGINGINIDLNQKIADRSDQLKSLANENGGLEKQVADRSKQIDALNKEVKIKNQLEKRLKDREIEISDLVADKERMNALLLDSDKEVSQLNAFLENKDLEIEQLNEDAKEKATLAKLLAEMEGALQTKETEIKGIRTKEEKLADKLAAKSNQLSSLSREAKEKDHRLTKALEELQVSEAELQKVEADFALTFTALGAFQGEKYVKEDAERGVLFTKRPNDVDDLKLISGIAEVLEGKLHDIGIYRFKQIALWKQEQIDVFSEQLSFKDRIENDLWVNQAADLHRRKYAENLAPQVDIYARKVIKPKPAPTTLIEKMFKGESVVENDKLGVVFTQPPAQIDDLKFIKGVAGVLEQQLNEHGVYQYKQIATWTPVQIEQFGEQLSFKDRIERDLWVHQAIDLHQEKYGEYLKPRSKLYNEVVLTPKKAAKKVKAKAKPKPAFAEKTVVEDKQFGLVFTERPEDIDDLKEIKGVGKVLEKALHKYGVYRFKQIALWSESVVQEFVDNLPFGDRVTRDLWIDQASSLHKDKYQESVAF